MLTQSPAHAVLPVTDLERARSFYEKNLGLKPTKQNIPDSLVFEAGGGTSVLLYRRPAVAHEHTQVGFFVKDVDQEVAALRKNGVRFEEYNTPELKTVNGVATVGGMRSAWLRDPDGNILCISERPR